MMRRLSVALIAAAMIAAGCGGSSNPSLDEAAELVGTWLLENVVIDGQTVAVQQEDVLVFADDGTYENYVNGTLSGGGTWDATSEPTVWNPTFTAAEVGSHMLVTLASMSSVDDGTPEALIIYPESPILPGTPSEYQYVPDRVVHPRYYEPE